MATVIRRVKTTTKAIPPKSGSAVNHLDFAKPTSYEDDKVNHPKHYNSHPSGIEAIEVARHMNFNLGNVLKYIWRSGHKFDRLEDLRKAQFYLNDEIDRLQQE